MLFLQGRVCKQRFVAAATFPCCCRAWGKPEVAGSKSWPSVGASSPVHILQGSHDNHSWSGEQLSISVLLIPVGLWGLPVQGSLGSLSEQCSFSKLVLLVGWCLSYLLVDVIAKKKSFRVKVPAAIVMFTNWISPNLHPCMIHLPQAWFCSGWVCGEGGSPSSSLHPQWVFPLTQQVLFPEQIPLLFYQIVLPGSCLLLQLLFTGDNVISAVTTLVFLPGLFLVFF